MAEHIPRPEIERFSVSALPEPRLETIAKHLAECEACHRVLSETLGSQRGTEGLRFTLAPEFWFRHDHLDYEQLVGIAENRLDATEREIIDIHLSTCATCREDVRSFVAFREQIEPELRVRYGPAAKEPKPSPVSLWNWPRGLAWKPASVAAVLLIGIGLIIAMLVLKRRAADLEAQRTPPSQINTREVGPTPTPENQTAKNVLPTPSPVPSEQFPLRAPSPPLTVKNQEPLKQSENAGAVAVLNDGLGTVTVDRVGKVSGLDEIPQNTRQEIGEALVAEKINAPAIETELAGGPISLRGPGKGSLFKLLSPARAVIISARPSFEWETLAGATSYRVLVGDLKGHEVAKSEELPAKQTTWSSPIPLKRGEIYSWAVEATVDGKKILSPGTSAPEMKFKILSVSSAQALEQLKTTQSHLALGVFYAREGMLAEAQQEFQILVRDNPRSIVLKKLLNQIQTSRGH
jgi:hypothetical protein